MARVAREVVRKAGIDVDKLLDTLLRNASAELTVRSRQRSVPPHHAGP